jgi:hypothetical protein
MSDKEIEILEELYHIDDVIKDLQTRKKKLIPKLGCVKTAYNKRMKYNKWRDGGKKNKGN